MLLSLYIVWNIKILGISSTGLNEYNLEKKYYLSFNYQSVGILYPKISDIVLLDYNNKPVPKENNLFSYEFFIDENRKTGVLTNDYVLANDTEKIHFFINVDFIHFCTFN